MKKPKGNHTLLSGIVTQNQEHQEQTQAELLSKRSCFLSAALPSSFCEEFPEELGTLSLNPLLYLLRPSEMGVYKIVFY